MISLRRKNKEKRPLCILSPSPSEFGPLTLNGLQCVIQRCLMGMARKGKYMRCNWKQTIHLLLSLGVLFHNTFCPLCKINICVDFSLSFPAFPPAAPVILNKEKHLTNRSFTLLWKKPADNGRPILRYLVFYREVHVKEKKQKNVSTNLCTLTLKWAKTYEFTVVAENDQGQSKNSKKKNFTVIPGEFLDIFMRNSSSLSSSLGGLTCHYCTPCWRKC